MAHQPMLLADHFYTEGKKTWFISILNGYLLEIDKETNTVAILDKIPGHVRVRIFSYCYKFSNHIYCLPDRGSTIWKYDCSVHTWSEIIISNQMRARIASYPILKLQDGLLIYASGWQTILHLSFEKNRIVKQIVISSNLDEQLEKAICVGEYIFFFSASYGTVYRYNIRFQNIHKMHLPRFVSGINAACYDGKTFWLSGKDHTIYAWDDSSNQISKLPLPSGFRIYNFLNSSDEVFLDSGTSHDDPIFSDILYAGGKVWFIPFRTNKILYLNRDYDLKEFAIDEENEDIVSLKNRILNHKCIVLYVREDGSIGLYSLKNEHVIEISATEEKYQFLKFDLSNVSLACYSPSRETCSKSVLWLVEYLRTTRKDPSFCHDDALHIGTCIYDELMK